MNDHIRGDFLKAYIAETDQQPSHRLRNAILAVPDKPLGMMGLFATFRFNPLHWFDLMVPKTVGWVLTGCLGLYFGIASSEQGAIADEDYYLYDQAQLNFIEDVLKEEMMIEDNK